MSMKEHVLATLREQFERWEKYQSGSSQINHC